MADKNYSVEINVGLNTDEADKELVSFKKKLTELLSGGGDLKFSVGGYGAGEDINQRIIDSLKKGNKSGNERVARQIADDLGDIGAEVVDLVKDNEGQVKRDLNEVAQRYAKMLGIEFVQNIAEALGEPDFAVPLEGMSPRRRQQATQDFMTSGQQVIYSPAAFISAIEKIAAQFPNAGFGAGEQRGLGLGLTRGALNQPVFQSAIPELTDEMLNSFQKLIHDSLSTENASKVGEYLRTRAQKVLDEIFERGFRAREATFASAGVSEGEESAENLVRYADASARRAIAEAEEEFGLALGTLARHIHAAGSQFKDFVPGVGGANDRVVSDPNMLRQIAFGDYEDVVGRLMSTPTNAPDIMEQVFLNPAILAAGKDGVKNFFDGLSKLVVTGGESAGGPQQKLQELIASGKRLTASFDSEFVDGLSSVITEASVVIKDDLGKLYGVFDLLQAPPASQEEILGRAQVGARSRAELQKRAQQLGYQDPLGAEEGVQNLKDFYPKLKGLIDILNQIAEAGIPLAGANLQGADFNRIAKAISNVNEAISANKLDLQPLQAPRGPYSEATMRKYPGAFSGGLPDRGTAQDIQQMMKQATGANAQGVKALAEGSTKVGNLLKGVADQLDDTTRNLIEFNDKGFKIAGMPAHTARADAAAAAIIYDAIEPFSGQGRPPSGGLDARRVSGIPEDGYEPFLNQLKGMNSVLSDMTEKEKEIFQARLKGFTATKEQLAIYHKIEDVQTQIADIQTKRPYKSTKDGIVGDNAAKQEVDALNQLITSYQVAGEANERRFASAIKFQSREDNFAGKNYQHARQRIDSSLEVEKADRAQRDGIVAGIKEQVAAEKRLESQNKNLMNTWVTGRYALYDVGNAYESVSRQLALAARRIFDVTNAYRSYETAFTSVERTVPTLAASVGGAAAEMRSLKDAFIAMSEEMPLTFEQLSQIATLGAQMGVSASGIVEFTKTVAQFAAITNISAETVAQKFGRIAELADVDYAQMNNLGSAVAFAGINAVATESEILTLAESIAAVSNQAGLLPPEIIGVATALASIGIQAEQARGVFTRVFADIDRAVSTGGSSLNAFANIAGMSADEFTNAWGEQGASYEVLRSLLAGLGATENLTAAFDSLNIVETREINTLTRLAKNLNVVDQAISDSNSAFETGTFLGTAFDKTVDNLDSKIQVLKNNFMALTEVLSGQMAGTMKAIIDFANDFISTLKELAKNSLYQWATFGALGLTAAGAAITFAISGISKLVAQVYAFRVAAINTFNSPTTATGIGAMLKQVTGFGSRLIEVRDTLQSISPETRGVITPINFNAFDKFEKTQQKLLQNNMFLIESEKMGLQTARARADQINQVLRIRRSEIAAVLQNTAATEAEKIAKLAEINANRIYVTSTGELVRGKISETEARQRNLIVLQAEANAATTAGRGIVGFGSRILGFVGIAGALLAVASSVGTAIGFMAEQFEKSKIKILESGGGLASLRDAIKQDTQAFRELTPEQQKSTDQFTTFERNVKVSSTAVDSNAVAIANATGAGESFVSGNQRVIESVDKQTFAVGQNTKAWFANAIMQDENIQKLLKEYPDFFEQVKQFGVDFQSVIQDIFANPDMDINKYLEGQFGGSEQILRKQLDSIRQQIQALEGVRGSNLPRLTEQEKQRLGVLKQQQSQLNGQLTLFGKMAEAIRSIAAAMKEGASGAELFNAIANALGIIAEVGDETENTITSAGRALRTVLDYASDLGGVLTRVKNLKFAKQIAYDQVADGWEQIKNKAADAEEAIKSANEEIKGLTADREIIKYQLAVAERYGDEKRAAVLRAKLAKVDENMSKAQKNLTKAQEASNTSLKDNTTAGRENRQALDGMLNNYQGLIVTLAESGVKGSALQKEIDKLKKEFILQAGALGYAESELDKYIGTFDEWKTVVKNMDRKVDVEVNSNISAATQALREYEAKLNSLNGKTVTVKIDQKEGITQLTSLLKPIVDSWTVRAMGNAFMYGAISAREYYKGVYGIDITSSGGFLMQRAQGGPVFGPGTGTSDSIPAMLSNGEYVVRAKAVSAYGIDFFNALNQQRVSFASATGSSAMSMAGGSGIVQLSPEDRALLRAAVDRPINLYADSKKIAQTANDGNNLIARRGVR